MLSAEVFGITGPSLLILTVARLFSQRPHAEAICTALKPSCQAQFPGDPGLDEILLKTTSQTKENDSFKHRPLAETPESSHLAEGSLPQSHRAPSPEKAITSPEEAYSGLVGWLNG